MNGLDLVGPQLAILIAAAVILVLDATMPQHRRAIPIIVLTADGTYAVAPPQVRSMISSMWTGWHQEIAALSACGEERAVSHSSHLMMIDRPDAIVAAIRDVLAITPARCTARRPTG